MSIQKININGVDVEIEDVSARTNISNLTNEVNTLDSRVTTLENSPGGGGSEWVELTTNNGQAEIKQEFSEIRMMCIYDDYLNYSITCNYDISIFPNTLGERYFICGNPKQGSYGCSFKYFVTGNGKKYVNLENCYDGDYARGGVLKVWIKPVQA